MDRSEVEGLVAKPNFGLRLCKRKGGNASVYDRVAQLAQGHNCIKDTALESKLWSLRTTSDEWLHLPVNLCRRCNRKYFQCSSDIYNYDGAAPGALIVDFANKHVGGGCFSTGFVQEEQMVMQSTDLAARLNRHRHKLTKYQGISYEGVYIDAWWPRSEAAKKGALNIAAIEPHISSPLTVFAVDAPVMRGKQYRQDTLRMLATKVLLIFAAAESLQSPQIFSGLLGGGAFRNNRPLVLLMHLLLQPACQARPLLFHHPIFWSFCGLGTETLEHRILEQADAMMEALRKQGVSSLGDALESILSWNLPPSEYDLDLA